MKKFNFNMVEIALAMVVIALGISGILGLFSVGVNAKKAAINENNIADAAEYILGLYRAVIVENYAQGTSDEFNIITATKSESYEKPMSFDISKITPAKYQICNAITTNPTTSFDSSCFLNSYLINLPMLFISPLLIMRILLYTSLQWIFRVRYESLPHRRPKPRHPAS